LKKVLLLALSATALFCNDLELRNYVGYELKAYLKKNDEKIDHNNALTFQNELKYLFEDSQLYSKIDILKDFSEEQRDYINLTEAYYLHSFSDFDFYFGKRVIFLGSLEAYNIVDIFNRQNYQKDMLNDDKKGAFLSGIDYYFEDDSKLNFYIKGFEQDLKFSSKNSPYYPFENSSYKNTLLFSNGNETPSFISTYSKTYDEKIVADVSYGLFYGYDNYILSQKIDDTYQSLLFQSIKLFTYNTFVIDSTLFKVEGSFTKIKDDGDYKFDDFYELGLGSEYTIERIIGNHNLGLIAEYYKSDTKLTPMDNDLFLALRYSLNDADSSEFLGGILKDLEDNEVSAYVKYEGRITDTLKINTDLRYIKSENYLDEHLRFGCELKYYF
jgi:hypothetical protein